MIIYKYNIRDIQIYIYIYICTSLTKRRQGMRCLDSSPTPWMWIRVNSRRWWRTGKPDILQFMGLQSRTKLSNWTTATTRQVKTIIKYQLDEITKHLLISTVCFPSQFINDLYSFSVNYLFIYLPVLVMRCCSFPYWFIRTLYIG